MSKIDPELVAAAQAYESLFVPALFGQWPPLIVDTLGVGEGNSALDIACGTGALASELYRRVGKSGKITGVDINSGMLEVARTKFPEILWSVADATKLPYPNACFDFVTCQFGLMFFSDPVKAVSEMIRVLRPGGSLLVAVWDKIENIPGYYAEMQLIEDLAGESAGSAVRVPFSLGDIKLLRDIFRQSGAITVEVVTKPGKAKFPSIRTMVEAELRGWLPIMGVQLPDEKIDFILNKAETVMAKFKTEPDTVEFDVASHFVAYTT